MDPRRDRNRAHAVAKHNHVFEPHPARLRNVTNEFVGVPRETAKARRVTARPAGATVAARIPREDRDVAQTKLAHDIFQPARMLVAPVKDD